MSFPFSMDNVNPYAALRRKGQPLFVPFAVLGDPEYDRSLQTIRTLVESGADALELGFPFSDPPADGPIIQAADQRALGAGMTVADCFRMLRDIRSFTGIPIGLLVYYNLILQRGIEPFYRACKESGVDSVLVADLPLEHAEQAVAAASAHGIAPVFLISDVTTEERLQAIASVAGGYLYVVSYLGVTGTSPVRASSVRSLLARARRHTDLPLFVGFGIRTPDDAAAMVGAGADGVIVGSAVVEAARDRSALRSFCRAIASRAQG